MSLSLLSTSGRYTILVMGVLGLFTSVQMACTFSDDPPAKKNPVTDTGPDKTGKDAGGGASSGVIGATSSGYYGYGYGYGYGPNGCYGYGYDYDPTFDPYGYSAYGYGSSGYGSSSGGCE